jgi:C-terminal processing protease CtpA/Prc
VADTAAAVARRMGAHRSYFHRSLDDRLVLNLLTRRQADGKYHLRYWERRVFQPRRRNAFRGRTFVLISGPTFSAASLFAGQMKGRENIFLLGEETGGAAYANNGLLLPECRLPNTRIRLTIPLFRIVPNGKVPNTGRGVEPDIRVEPDAESVRMGIDRKFERVRKYILENPAGQ